jgi:hypothetical protein
MLEYLKYSGINIILKVNPFHWDLGFLHEYDEFDGRIFTINLAMFTIKIWIDNGNW